MAGRRIYLDHVASTPTLPAVGETVARVLATVGGNPSSPHLEGRAARDALEEARTRVAASLRCRPREVVFTSGGTEALALALLGGARARRAVSSRVVLSSVEHPAVLDGASLLHAEGFEIVRVPVDGAGRVDPAAFLEAAAPGAAVAALMLANHEAGAVMPVAEVARGLRGRGIPLVTDAALGPGRLPVGADDVPADLVALSAHKFGGPPGAGALFVRRGTRVAPLWGGGWQEDRLRPGTEAVAGAVGLAVALERAQAERASRAARYERWTALWLAGLGGLAGWRRLGPERGGLPGLVTIEIQGVEGEAAMINLDLEGVAVATGSSCALGGTDPSPGLLAMGLTARRAASTIRVSFGEGLDDGDVSHAAQTLRRVVERVRALGRS